MAQFPSYDFSEPELNYDEVEASLKELVCYLDRNQTTICCPAKAVAEAMFIVTPKLAAMKYNKDADDEAAYQLDVKVCYSLLYKFVS